MTAATLPARPQEARRAMTRPAQPRARATHPAQARAHTILAAFQAAHITPQVARTELLTLVMAARTGTERWTLLGLQRTLRAFRLARLALPANRRLRPEPDPATRAKLDAEFRHAHHRRHAANALAQALWAVQQGDREWESIPTRPTTLQAAAPTGPSSSSVTGPARLTVRIPASPWGAAGTLTLYRAEYERTLSAWGIDRARAATALTADMRAAFVPDAIIEQAAALTLDAATHPNLARSWHAYITSPRLSDIYAPHSSGTMQLAPRRNGDLREALERIMVLTEYKPLPD